MARKSRIDAPGVLHNIIVRGIERRSIFVDAQDYENFIKRLGNILTDEIKSQSRRRVVARSRAVISIVAIEQMGFSGADVAKVLNITPSAVSKLVLRARIDPAVKDGTNNVLNLL
jgi:predicted XRE-type DNA-binding protein